MTDKKRELGYDFVRVIAMLFVIALHTNPKPYANGSIWQELFLSVFFACNGLFFMLSGRFALSKKLSGVKEILNFYKRKLFSLFIPLVFFGFLYCLVGLYKSGEPFAAGVFFGSALKGLLSDYSDSYLWFMFVLVGLTLSAPFLGRLFQHMTDNELHLLAAIGLIWEILSVYLGKNTGLGFGYSNWFLNGWPFYYFLGYYAYRVLEKSSKKKLLILIGMIAFVVNALWTWKMPLYSYNAHDLAPLYTVFVVGFYLLLGSAKINGEGAFGKIVRWIAAQSYFVYLLHRILLKLWINDLSVFAGKLPNYLIHYLICVICSLVIAFLLNLAYRPVLKKTDRA